MVITRVYLCVYADLTGTFIYIFQISNTLRIYDKLALAIFLRLLVGRYPLTSSLERNPQSGANTSCIIHTRIYRICRAAWSNVGTWGFPMLVPNFVIDPFPI